MLCGAYVSGFGAYGLGFRIYQDLACGWFFSTAGTKNCPIFIINDERHVNVESRGSPLRMHTVHRGWR